ncbi:MAG: glycosyltransferase, partial [Alphaproteobacteria bacterium]
LPFAVSAHAKDIWTTPDWDIAEKITDAAWLTTCTRAGAEQLRSLAGDVSDRIHLNYHGLDFARFPRNDSPDKTADTTGPLQIASVGRLVAKKGYDDLLDALARLPADLDWRLEHIGGGALSGALQNQARRLGIDGRIDWHGRQPQTDVRALLARADMFVLASKIAPDGDRDGLPNVLLEAQSMGVACVATDEAGIPELITDGETGILTAPGDPAALADAIQTLAADAGRRAAIAAAGARNVRERFDMNAGLDAIADDLRDAAGPPASDTSAAAA